MSEKRKDNKGRILRDNEYQRSDGRYEFKFVDQKGERHSTYSWRLVSSDATPPGKRRGEPLREIEKRIAEELKNPVETPDRTEVTLNELFDDYISSKIELKDTTRSQYKRIYENYVRDDIGTKLVTEIRFTDVRKFYMHLLKDVGIKPNTIDNVQTILHPVFQDALRDGLINMNPTDGVMVAIKRSCGWERPKRKALTIPEQTAFMGYVSSTRKFVHWLPLFTLLLGTGCRIGEALGLRWQDCDFENNVITIDHALAYQKFDDGKTEFRIMTPKTKSGIRQIPMLKDVRDVLRREFARQSMVGFNDFEISGYSGFIFSSRPGKPLSPQSVNTAIRTICERYNAFETDKAREEERDAVLLPHFSAHNLRHTFCTRFCENETNLKIIQEIMGHASISITMDVYNEATMDKKVASFANLDDKIKIG